MSGFSSLFKLNKIECVLCKKKVRDNGLAKMVANTADGQKVYKVCKKCEKELNKVSKDVK